MKIVFSYLPFAVLYNHGVALLTALCRCCGIQAYIVPMITLDEWLFKIKGIQPDFIGFSFVTRVDFEGSFSFVQAAKATGIPVLAGGVYVRRRWADIRRINLFDYVCPGEAEILPEFLLRGETRVFDQEYYHQDISALPLPDYSRVTGFEFQRGYDFFKGMRIFPYSSSRGCPYCCSFCAVQYQPAGVRIKSTVRWDLLHLHERFMPDLIYFMDELPPYYDDGWKASMEGNRIPFLCYIRANIRDADLKFLIKNGMKFCAFGVESGDETYRNEVLEKNLSDDQIMETVAILRESNVTYIPFFMTDTPGETEEVRQKTMAMVDRIGGHPQLWQYDPLREEI